MKDRVKKFKALADDSRLRVLELLEDGPKCVSQIASKLKVPQNLLSHHLKILREADLVQFDRAGNNIYYKLSPAVGLNKKKLELGCCSIELR